LATINLLKKVVATVGWASTNLAPQLLRLLKLRTASKSQICWPQVRAYFSEASFTAFAGAPPVKLSTSCTRYFIRVAMLALTALVSNCTKYRATCNMFSEKILHFGKFFPRSWC
jgi:hypothetical protein